MQDSTTTADKRIVEQLNYDGKTAKRVGWEAWEFSIAGPYQVEVTNAAYGFLTDDHSYIVGIDKRAGVPVPVECDCPADVHREPDCKHKVALATIGGTTVLNAAMEIDGETGGLSLSEQPNVTTAADKLETDGGTTQSTEDLDVCPNGDAHCEGPSGDVFPCFECFEVEQ